MSVPYVKHVIGAKLDLYLHQGWFRMGRHIHTTDAIVKDDVFHPVIWIRYNLKKFAFTKSHLDLQKQLRKFNIKIDKYFYTPEDEALYQTYMQSRKFDGSSTLQKFLFEHLDQNAYDVVYFNSYAINIYHGEQRIGTGIFDIGQKSIAGIINYFDPQYQKHSLGKQLILQKLQFAIDANMDYYYPGYIVPTISHFGYKTFVGEDCIEAWDYKSNQWKPYNSFVNTKLLR